MQLDEFLITDEEQQYREAYQKDAAQKAQRVVLRHIPDNSIAHTILKMLGLDSNEA